MSQVPDTKRSATRLRRFAEIVERTLDAPAALEILVAEAEIGQLHPELWEQLHATAARDDKEIELGAAYEQVARGRRLKPLAPATQAAILMHGADYLQGILGDSEGAAVILRHVVAVVPDHAEAFGRLERFYIGTKRNGDLVQLLATVAAAQPIPSVLLIGRAVGLIAVVAREESLPQETCERLVRIAGKNMAVVAALETHCTSRARFRDAVALMELAIQAGTLAERDILALRRRLLALCMGEAKAPEKAIVQVEEILQVDPTSPEARKAADKLLTVSSVAARATAALHAARRRVP